MVKVKFTASKELVVDGAGNGIGNFAYFWGDQINPGVVQTLRIQDSDEWVRYRNLYSHFQVRGVKMEFRPYVYSGGAVLV